MFKRYFSFSGVITKAEYKKSILAILKWYFIFTIFVLVGAYFMNLTSIVEMIIFQVVLVCSAFLFWSFLSLTSRYLAGLHQSKK